ncbi:MAG: IS110 family transposase [Flavobacteriaceae bacterium]|nr:IS110 family transposase [Flavobacteriaceae bacterium]
MDNYANIYGIDISKNTFDVVDLEGNHSDFKNTKKGFMEFKKTIKKDSLCVMEVTGIYHLNIAKFLFKKKIDVSVVNPLRIKRFSQMLLKRNKTDKADAKMIATYGDNQKPNLWEPCSEKMEQSKDIYKVMDQMIRFRAGLRNKLSTLTTKETMVFTIKEIKEQILSVSVSILNLESKINELVKEEDAELLTNLKSISGIGERTATLLIMSTDRFKNFDSSKKLSSYFGLAPTEHRSGTSVNGSNRISKMGNPDVRKTLYMCALQASRNNKTCSVLYNRLLDKGKPKKVALIAVANKLLKITFAIAKSGLKYDPNYVSKLDRSKIVSST